MKEESKDLASWAQTVSSESDPAQVSEIALKTGFIKRNRKIRPLNFIKAVGMTFNTVFSLRACALVWGFMSGRVLSRQALSKHLTSESEGFVRHVLFAILSEVSHLKKQTAQGVFSPFRRVLIRDIT